MEFRKLPDVMDEHSTEEMKVFSDEKIAPEFLESGWIGGNGVLNLKT